MSDDSQDAIVDPQTYFTNLRLDQVELKKQESTLEKAEGDVRNDIAYLEKMRKGLEAKIKFLRTEDITLANANAYGPEIISRLNEVGSRGLLDEELTQANRVVSSVLNLPTLYEEKTALEESLESVIPKPGRKTFQYKIETFLFPESPPLSVYEQHKQLLDPVSLPDIAFWNRFSSVCGFERSMCIQTIPKYEEKLSGVLAKIGDVSILSPAPQRDRLKELQEELRDTRESRSKVDTELKRWNEIYRERKKQLHDRGISDTEIEQIARERANVEVYEEIQKEDRQEEPSREETTLLPADRRVEELSPPRRMPTVRPRLNYQSAGVGGNWRTALVNFTRDPWNTIKNAFTSTRTRETTRAVAEGVEETGETVVQTVAGSGWRANLRVFFNNPIGSVVNFFRGAKTTQTAVTAAKVGATAAAAGGTAAAEGGAVAAGTAAGGVPGLVIAAVLLAKKIIDSEQVKNILSKLKIAGGAVALWLILNPGALIGGMIGGLMGGALGPAGAAAGFAAGAFVGYSLQSIASSIFGFGGGVPVASGAAPGVTAASSLSFAGFTIPGSIASAVTSFGGILGGTGITTFTLVGVGGGISVLLLSITLTLAAVLQTPEQQTKTVGQTVNAMFTLQKEAVPAEFPVFDGNEITITYKLIIKAGEHPVKILTIMDKLTRSNSTSWSKNLPINNSDQINAGETKEIIYTTPIFGNEFMDCYLKNAVEVKVKDITTSQEDTLTASTRVRLRSPVVDTNQPFGYPATGYLTSIDQTTRTGGTHWSYFYYPGIKVYGGLDIAKAGGNAPVYATMRGQVKKAEFIRNSDPIKDVGGVVYLENGAYIVEYKHLDESVNNLTVGQWVERGDLLGQTFSGELGAISGPHVHYQILYNRGNLDFNKPTNWGNCLDGKILSSQPFFDQLVEPGPFMCQ